MYSLSTQADHMACSRGPLSRLWREHVSPLGVGSREALRPPQRGRDLQAAHKQERALSVLFTLQALKYVSSVFALNNQLLDKNQTKLSHKGTKLILAPNKLTDTHRDGEAGSPRPLLNGDFLAVWPHQDSAGPTPMG
jgi:hypothetical protein